MFIWNKLRKTEMPLRIITNRYCATRLKFKSILNEILPKRFSKKAKLYVV